VPAKDLPVAIILNDANGRRARSTALERLIREGLKNLSVMRQPD
jgi:hypothetical protein